MERISKVVDFFKPLWRKMVLVVFLVGVSYAAFSQTALHFNKPSSAARKINLVKIEPSKGPIGTEIRVYGDLLFLGKYKINVNNVRGVLVSSSVDGGRSLSFKFPASVCPLGKMCAAVLPLPGVYNISVTNSLNQTSTSLPFFLIQNITPTTTMTTTTTTVTKPTSTTKAVPVTAYFEIGMTGAGSSQNFNIMLTNSSNIQHARDLIARRTSTAPHVSGIITVVDNPVSYNPNWHFNLDSGTISFFESAMEVCDSGPLIIESHLSEVGGSFLPGNQWCPWASYVIREIE